MKRFLLFFTHALKSVNDEERHRETLEQFLSIELLSVDEFELRIWSELVIHTFVEIG